MKMDTDADSKSRKGAEKHSKYLAFCFIISFILLAASVHVSLLPGIILGAFAGLFFSAGMLALIFATKFYFELKLE